MKKVIKINERRRKQQPLKQGESINGSKASQFAALFADNSAALQRFLKRFLDCDQDVHDVAQEAFVKVMARRDEEVVQHLRAYLFRTAHNLAMDRLRERRNQWRYGHCESVEADQVESSVSDVEELQLLRERIARLESVVNELPPKCRRAFLLYKFENLSYEEIARQMSLTESMIRKYVLKAVRYCMQRLDDLSL